MVTAIVITVGGVLVGLALGVGLGLAWRGRAPPKLEPRQRRSVGVRGTAPLRYSLSPHQNAFGTLPPPPPWMGSVAVPAEIGPEDTTPVIVGLPDE